MGITAAGGQEVESPSAIHHLHTTYSIYFSAMGRSEKPATASMRHDPLGVQLRTDTSGLLSAPGRRPNKKHKKAAKEEDGHIDSKTSSKILQLAREQQDEELDSGTPSNKSR